MTINHVHDAILRKLHTFHYKGIIWLLILNFVFNTHYMVYAKESPVVIDENLQIDLIVKGLELADGYGFSRSR